MAEKVLKVSWRPFTTTEYVDIDVNALSRHKPIEETCEWWPEYQKFVYYNTTSKISLKSKGFYEIEITYDPKNNPHIDLSECDVWGTSTIILSKITKNGIAAWKDAHDHENNCKVKWQLIKSIEKKNIDLIKIAVFKQKRDAKFRDRLIAHGKGNPCCAITGESTLSALEAAHIIPSVKLGPETLNNGVLLRADLHRLYDAGGFIIMPDGSLKILKQLSKNYEKILEKSTISPNIMEKIKTNVLRKLND